MCRAGPFALNRGHRTAECAFPAAPAQIAALCPALVDAEEPSGATSMGLAARKGSAAAVAALVDAGCKADGDFPVSEGVSIRRTAPAA